MLQNSRLIFIPSLQKFLRFKELRNDHLFALFKTQDSIVDSIAAQNDILHDCWVEDGYKPSQLTLLDVFSIFLTWRINCVDSELIFDYGDHVEVTELTDWMHKVGQLGSTNFTRKGSCGGYTYEFGMLTLEDDFEMQRESMLSNVSDEVKQQEMRKKLNSVCSLKELNGYRPKNFYERNKLYEELPSEMYGEFDNYQKFVESKCMEVGSLGDIQNSPVYLFLEVIPSLIKFIFSGSSENMLQETVYLSKESGISFTDYMKMSQLETHDLINFIREVMNPDTGDDGEELIS